MPRWSYDLAVPDDAPDDEVAEYRELAVSTWHTAVEASGARPGVPQVELRRSSEPDLVLDKRTGESVPGPRRRWHVEGDGD